jgi:hypothetical protein
MSFPPLDVQFGRQGSRGVYIRAQRGSLPPRASDMLAVRNRAIDGIGLSPTRFAALPAATGNCTPSLSQIPDLTLSRHPARATARRLPPSAEFSGSSWFDPVGPSSAAMTCPLRSTGITPLHHYYEAVRPSPAHRYFRPRGWSRLCLFPWHRRPGSHVPYESPNESHASSTPDATWTVSRTPSMLIPEDWQASGFDVV